jgi:hypothetical protein
VARCCVFCGGQPVTVEDVFPLWLGDYLGRGPAYRVSAGMGGGQRRGFRGLSMTARVKRVCRDCNNGWMSRLETEASAVIKPLLNETLAIPLTGGTGGSLTLLARWAMKTALMLQYVHRDPAIPPAVYEQFHSTQLPPSQQCRMFLARHAKHGIPDGAHSIGWSVKGPASPSGAVAYEGLMYGVTFCIANVVIQIVGYVPTVPAAGTFTLNYPSPYWGYVEQLWPAVAGITWPLSRPVLDDPSLIAFSRALAGIRPISASAGLA